MRLNGSTVGLDQRRQWLAKWKAELGPTPIALAPAGPRVILSTTPRPPPPDIPKPVAPAAPPSLTTPAKGSIGAFIASILTAVAHVKASGRSESRDRVVVAFGRPPHGSKRRRRSASSS
jgi:hypothetical protein